MKINTNIRFHFSGKCLLFTFLIISLSAQGQSDPNKRGFIPMLLKAEVSTDMGVSGDNVLVTAYWQNVGDRVADVPLQCFLEMELGHQRTTEITEKYNRYIWDPMPGTSQWKPGDIHEVTYHLRLPGMWGGTYRLFLGFYAEDHVPFDLLGKDRILQKRIRIGEIDLGWGWGIALMQLIKKPWTQEFNKPEENIVSTGRISKIDIGKDITASFDGSIPKILSITELENIYPVTPLQPEVEFRDYVNDKILSNFSNDVVVTYTSKKMGGDSLKYEGTVNYKNKKIASFILNCKVAGRKILITLGDKWEAPDFELLEIKLFSLFSGSGKDTYIVNFMGGGRLIPLETAIPQGYRSHYDTRNALAIYNSKSMVVLESTCLDDMVYTMVDKTNNEKSAVIGASIVTRVRGKNKVRSIEVPNVHRIELNFLGKEWGTPSWINIARFLRKDLKGRNRDFYRKAIFSLDYITQGPAPEPWQETENAPLAIKRLNRGFKFPQVLEIIRKYSNLLDGYKQIPQLYGWFKIQDEDKSIIGFPYAGFGVDPRGGTAEELKTILKESRKYNAYLQFYQNYDDFFYSKYNDPSIVAIDEEGNPWKGWIWADGLSYIIGPYKYVKTGKLQERIKKMVEIWDMKDCTHMDVLSSEPLRFDFDPKYPASAEMNYWGKLDIIKEYNKYGIEVTSETLVHPFVGYLGYGYNTRMNSGEAYFYGEKFIPLVAAVYHGTIQYNAGGSGKREILNGLIAGGNAGFELEKEDYEPVKGCYLQGMPMGEIYDEKMEDYREENRVYNIKYTNDSYINMDLNKQTYEIAHKGRVIGKDWTTFVPGAKTGSYLAYSLDGGEMSYSAPEGWSEKSKLRAVRLTTEGEGEEVPCKIVNGKFIISMPASTPVRATVVK